MTDHEEASYGGSTDTAAREPVKKSCSGLLLGGHTGYDV